MNFLKKKDTVLKFGKFLNGEYKTGQKQWIICWQQKSDEAKYWLTGFVLIPAFNGKKETEGQMEIGNDYTTLAVYGMQIIVLSYSEYNYNRDLDRG